MRTEFSHAVLPNQNLPNRPQAIPPAAKPQNPYQANEHRQIGQQNNYKPQYQYKEQLKPCKPEVIPQRPKPIPYQQKDNKVNPQKPPRIPQEVHNPHQDNRREEKEIISGNKGIVNYHYQKRKENQDQNKKPQNYYDELWKQMEERRRITKAVNNKPKEEERPKPEYKPKLEPKLKEEQKPRMEKRHVVQERQYEKRPEVKPISRPITEEKPRAQPNFYIQNYKPYRYEEEAQIIPIPKKCTPVEPKKKLKELKEKARKADEEKKELVKEQKKREEERVERAKRREEERKKMRSEIEKMRKKGKVKKDDFCLVQNTVPEPPKAIKKATEIKPNPTNELEKDKEKPKEEAKKNEVKKENEQKEKAKKKRKSRKKTQKGKNSKFSKDPVLILYKPPNNNKEGENKSIEAQKQSEGDSEDKREDVKGLETARFGDNVNKKPQEEVNNLKVTSKSIKDQVEFLTKSIFNRQQAKLKEEQQLEEDILKLAKEYQDVLFFI